MNKRLLEFLNKMEGVTGNNDGLQGGFLSITGGRYRVILTGNPEPSGLGGANTNPHCSNGYAGQGNCDNSSNAIICSNSGSCVGAQNRGSTIDCDKMIRDNRFDPNNSIS